MDDHNDTAGPDADRSPDGSANGSHESDPDGSGNSSADDAANQGADGGTDGGGNSSADEAAFRDVLTSALSAMDVTISGADIDRCLDHYRLVVAANARFNLTRITTPADAAVKHYADSLALLRAEIKCRHLLDLGTGAGFPAVPLAIARPSWSVTAIDGRGKKAAFVASACETLGLSNVTAIHAHSDHWDSDRVFDVVAARAVAALGVVIRQAERHLSRDGVIVAYKSAALSPDEEAAARELLAKERLRERGRVAYSLVCGNERLDRQLILIARR